MTSINIDTKAGTYEAQGHAGYARAGEDIVCAAVSVISDLMRWAAIMSHGEQSADGSHVSTRGISENYLFMLGAAAWAAAQLEGQYPEYVRLKMAGGKDESES